MISPICTLKETFVDLYNKIRHNPNIIWLPLFVPLFCCHAIDVFCRRRAVREGVQKWDAKADHNHHACKEKIEKTLASRSLRKDCDCRGTYDEKILYQFVEKYRDKIQHGDFFTILLFIDQDTYGIDIEEWRSFSNHSQAFEEIGFKIFGNRTLYSYLFIFIIERRS